MLSVVGFGSGRRRRRPLIPPQSAARVASPTSDLARSLGQPDDVVEAARPRGRPEEAAGRGVKESEDGTGLFGPQLSSQTDRPSE